MKEYLIDVLKTLWEDRYDVFLICGVLLYRKELEAAFKGGDGIWQMNEVAKAFIIFLIYVSFRNESAREDLSQHLYFESYWFALLGGLAAIAGFSLVRKPEAKENENTD